MKNINPKIIKSKIHKDSRGVLQEIFRRKQYMNDFKFSLFVASKKNVFRGLHFQIKKQQEKIVVVVNGEVVDYCLDLRKNLSLLVKYLNLGSEKNQFYSFQGFAHGYLALKDNTQMIYLLSEMRFKKFEKTFKYFR